MTTSGDPAANSSRRMRRYDVEVDLTNTNLSQTQLVLLCGEGKDVLEVGSANGCVTEALSQRGCRVTAIEIDTQAAEFASQHAHRMIVGDIEELDLGDTFGDSRFQVALFGDVLEHLTDPVRALTKVRAILAEGGYVVASIPNISHGSVRLALLTGRFRYTDVGLLDRTHLRFYDRLHVEEVFRTAGYTIREMGRIERGLFETEVDIRPQDFPPHLVEAVQKAPESSTYQFIVVADPAASEVLPPLDAEIEVDSAVVLAPLWQLEKYASALEMNLVEVQSAFDEVQSAFDQALNTQGFRALARLYHLRNRLAPAGTVRRTVAMALARPVLRLLAGRRNT